jgi:MraZ protein
VESQGGSVLTQGEADEARADAGTRPHPQPRFELTGNVERTLDPKGRLVIPAQVRARFDDGVFLLPWAGPSVALIPTDEFRKIERRLRKKQRETMSDPDAHLALTSLATHAFPDAQGRVVIPEPTRQHGHLTDELLVVGRMNRLELWQPAAFHAKQAAMTAALEAQIFTEAL